MTARFRKKARKLRGSKTHGWGSKKKHRGAGSRGGRGNAGLLKHKRSWMLKYDPHHFGKYGFLPVTSRKPQAINLYELQKIAKGPEVDLGALGYEKLLGKGNIEKPITVKVRACSEKAKEKIESVGGKVITG
jgi:large subunit ribosomal protein L15